MRRRLRWLTIIAGVTLLSMVGLQLFWLRATYKEQERTFFADAENALFTTVLTEAVNKVSKQDVLLEKIFQKISLPAILSAAEQQTNIQAPDIVAATSKVHLKLSLPDSLLADTTELKQLLVDLKKRNGKGTIELNDSLLEKAFFQKDDDLNVLKGSYAKNLSAKGYWPKIEVAILDSVGKIMQASCDPSLFRQIKAKTSTREIMSMTGPAENVLQFAFPDLNILLLKRMGTILTISSLLIIFCLSSSTYLMILFFRQKRIAEIRNDFMNNMTHELKTPISSVSVAIELMHDAGIRGASDAMLDYMQIAQGELNRLTMLVEKVLKIAAFEKGEIHIFKENFAADSWVQQVYNSFKPIFETGGVVCNIEVKPASLTIHADKTHLTNVLHNLIDNAIKYNDKSQLLLSLIVQNTDTETYIMVKDNGMGISAADQSKVFDKFYRVPHGNLHEIKGYGLGLSYVWEIVRLHQGQVRIESVPGQGSTFIITLPKQ